MKSEENGLKKGQRFGRLTLLDKVVTTAQGEKKHLCRCDCGTERYVLERSLKSGGSLSCGCLRRERAQQATAYDLLGKTFGELRVVGKSRKRTRMGAYWTCLCSCGYTCEATASELVSGRKTNCGCKNVKNYASSDITGQRFGRLTAQYSSKKRDAKGFVIWHCHCDCGNETDVSYNNLMYCGQQSCGCKKREHDMNRTPFVRQYGTLLTNGVLFMPKGVPNKRYTGEFKQEVVETMQREKLSYKEVARLYGITAHDRVASWERIYLEEGPEGLYIERRGRGSKGSPPKKLKPEVEEDLLAEVQRLRAENAYLKKLNALVAERVRQERKQK